MAKSGRTIAELRNLAKFLKDSKAPRRMFHGTTQDVQSFQSDPIWLALERSTAAGYADRKAFGNRETHDEDYRIEDEYSPKHDKVGPAGQNLMPLHPSIKNPLDLTKLGAASTLDEAIGELQEMGFLKDIDEDNYGDVINELEGEFSTEDLNVRADRDYIPVYRILEGLNVYPEIKAAGHDGVKIFDTDVEGGVHESWAAFDPRQVKSSIGNKGTYDPENPDITFAKGGKVKTPARTALDELKEYQNALAPRSGMFSTLDKLIEEAPFERGSAEQWRGFLKPGRPFKREGVEFPLKKEELDYALRNILEQSEELYPGDTTKNDILNAMRASRPEFSTKFSTPEDEAFKRALQLGNEVDPQFGSAAGTQGRHEHVSPKYGVDYDPRLSHQSPGSRYEETATNLAGLDYGGHFSPDTLSWSRATRHTLPSNERIRLIEEIQSDLHQDAADPMDIEMDRGNIAPGFLVGAGNSEKYAALHNEEVALRAEYDNGKGLPADRIFEVNRRIQEIIQEKRALIEKSTPRRGYRTPEDEARMQASEQGMLLQENPEHSVGELIRLQEQSRQRVPDAPFKKPEEYAALEMRKQLLDAVNNDEDYLAITRGDDQVERYSLDDLEDPKKAEGMRYAYDTIYRNALEKLGKRYGAEMTEVTLPTKSKVDIRPNIMRDVNAEDMSEFMDAVASGHYYGGGDPYSQMLWDIGAEFPDSGAVHQKILNAQRSLDAYNEAKEIEGDSSEELNDLEESMTAVWDIYKNRMGSGVTAATKTFPALKLTPEIREKIKRAGVPLWALGLAAPGLELMQQQYNEEKPHFAKGGKVKASAARTAMEELQEYANALAPQKGMFSTLDKLIETAPFERGSSEQWRGYLKPGRPFTREGIQFPLKKEELDYTDIMKTLDALAAGGEGADNLSKLLPAESILDPASPTKDQLLTFLRRQRPGFQLDYRPSNTNMTNAENIQRINEMIPDGQPLGRGRVHAPSYNPERDPTLSHQSPESKYEESVTNYADLDFPGHYDNSALSWGRTSSHELPNRGGKMRLIEELQSDVHGAASEKVGNFESQTGLREALQRVGNWNRYQDLDKQEAGLLQSRWDNQDPRYRQRELDSIREEKLELVNDAKDRAPRRGYLDPDEAAEYKQLYNTLSLTHEQHNRLYELKLKRADAVPDAPFKDLEFANLELKKQLLNAANAGEDYLALTTGNDQVARYNLDEHDPEAAEGMRYVYDNRYRSMMQKIAAKFGAEVVEVEAPLGSTSDVRPDAMRQLGAENVRDYMDAVERGAYMRADGDPYEQLIWDLTPAGSHDHPPSIRAMNAVRDYRKATDAEEDASDELMELDEALESLWYDHKHAHETASENQKTFPAIKLTPEIRERIKRVGVPLWTAAGAAALTGLESEDSEAAPPGFAKGGKITTMKGLRQRIQEHKFKVDRPLIGPHRHPDGVYRLGPDPKLSPEEVARLKAEQKRLMDHLESLDKDPDQFAEGGPVARPKREVIMPPKPDPIADLKRAYLGLMTQVGGTRDGEVIGPIMNPKIPSWDVGGFEIPSVHISGWERPGMVDDFLSLPDVVTLGHGPEASKQAGNRAQALDEGLRERLDVAPPEGVWEHLLEAGGAMAGQVPIATEPLVVGATKYLAPLAEKVPSLLRKLGKIPGAAAEWFSPTIDPGAVNYLKGTAAGTALTMTLPELMMKLEEFKGDPWTLAAKAAQSGELPPDLAFELAYKLDPQGDDMMFREQTSSDEDNQEALNALIGE